MKSERKRAIDRLDNLIRAIVKLRDHFCVTCGASPIEVGHLITRGNHAVRWNLKNCHGQCRTCNSNHERNQQPYIEWFVENYGQEEYEELVRISHQELSKYKLGEIEVELIAELNRLRT